MADLEGGRLLAIVEDELGRLGMYWEAASEEGASDGRDGHRLHSSTFLLGGRFEAL
ncbi:MAG: hypothetical protein MI920_17685 [Kiloniellales bacterium]|nr:hypothetical protein [Kiloniellales bacterium]